MDDTTLTVRQRIMRFIDGIESRDDIKLEEIPEYRLYISQLEEFFEKKLGKALGDDEEKRTISKTMIQNYIKEGLLMPPNGKCYNRAHIILLTLIYNLKSILTIKDIKKLLSPLLSEANDEANIEKIEHLYNVYLALKKRDTYADCIMDSMETIKNYLDDDKLSGEKDEKIRLFLLVLILIEQANVRKKIVEYIINEFFGSELEKEP
ncbi:DUF1836 domain-containing protein [Caldicoprobacter faecalis]|uniref:DUF1836 domain-containing protein n=1 Tax=Caldicoprobacter faecalis TaxID=937334 RepID=A0A1I5SJE7_9FIRM|nr:DUF1836 domain-containing protein [Caldicoprobacter faecalis]SFP70865.1 protein of unknown function [Caldicoprobacter faecalis]